MTIVDTFLKKAPSKKNQGETLGAEDFFTVDSTPRNRKLTQFFQSFISLRIVAAAQIGFLFMKAFYLSFQMHTNYAENWRHLFG